MTLYLGRNAVNATLAIGGGNVDDVQVDGVSVVTNKVAEIDLTGKQDVISDLSTIRSGATAGATAVQPGDLATVATSGSYNDLSNKPTIPSAQVNSDWNSSSGVSQILNKPTLGTMAAENTTSYYTKTELDGKLNSAMHFKGTKARVADLPSSGQEVGDMWNVQSTGANYAWDGSSWDKLSENIDLSGLQPNLTSSNAGTGISITGSGSNVVISNTQTSAEWGNITGTLSSQTDLNTALGNKQDTISDLATIRSGASAGSTAVQPSDLATVATSGSYNDLSNKPSEVTESTVSGWGFTKNTGTVTSVNNVSPVNGNVTISIPTVDQTYDATSANAQSGVAINGAKFIQNTATGSNALTVGGTASGYTGGTNIGISSQAKQNYGTALGFNTNANGNSSTCIGRNAGTSAASAIQIGAGINSTANTLQVGFIHASTNYKLLDGTTGLIPSDRIPIDNSTITVNSSGQLIASGGSGISRNIGELIQSTIPLTDAGLHLLDGSVINGSGSYGAFVTYIAGFVSSYPDLFTTEANWQTAVTTYGVCGKFVYDSTNNTVRLPKITGFIEGTTDITALGDLIEAGLPNITGAWKTAYNINQANSSECEGALYAPYGTSPGYYGGSGAGADWGYGIKLDASYSDSIYGNSTTVQPQAIKILYYIVIATSTKTNIQVDIDEVMTDLNGKVDIADLAECTVIVETYHNGTSWYRVYSDGWCEQGGEIQGLASSATVDVVFLKEFADTNYYINVSDGIVNSTWAGAEANDYMDALTSTKFTFKQAYGRTCNFRWQACGYIR